jgi:predicted ester cyclase
MEVSMSADENKAAVRRFAQQVISAGNMAAFDELVSPAYVEHTPSPGGGTDRDSFLRELEGLHNAFPDLKTEEEDLVAEGDKVVYRGTLSGTHRGEFFGIPPTGRSFRISELHINVLKEGRLVEHWGIFDSLGLMQQLGVIPQQGG